MGNPLNTAEPQNSVPLRGVRACVFDAYGTLSDFAAAGRKCRDVFGDTVERLTTLWRDKQLQYTWLRAPQGRHADFWQVTGDALDFSLDTLNLNMPGLRDRLMALYLTLEAFLEVPNVLSKLKQPKPRFYRTAYPQCSTRLSKRQNSTHCSTRTSRSRQLASTSHAQKVYQLAVDWLGVSASVIAFPSSNVWDANAASALGMQVVWWKRYCQRREHLPGSPDHEIKSLTELAALVGA